MSFPLLILPFLLFLFKYIYTFTCPNYCKSCYQENEEYPCLFCKEGYHAIKNPSGENGVNCEKCKVENCKDCSSSSDQCISCNFGYYLIGNNNCTQCDYSCRTCETSATNCLSCNDGYYSSGTKCFLCEPTCRTCVTRANCSSCITGYYLSNSKCLPCNSPCQTCAISANDCLSCIDG